MKKTLIAVAALAATSAFAQNVTISGIMDGTFRSSKLEYQSGTSANQMVVGKDGSGTTGFTLSGNEDLGGGLKAVFLYEQNFDLADTGAAQANGQQYVGLSGAFGTFTLGSPNTPHLTVQGARGAGFGTKDGGRSAPIGATLMGTSLTRFDKSMSYTTPNFSGFSIQALYIPKTEADTAGGIAEAGSTTDLGAFYNNGPISAGLAAYTVSAVTGGDDTKQTSYYASYNFGFAKFTLGGHSYKLGAAENTGLNLAADVPLSSALTLTVNLQTKDDKDVANLDTKMNAIGVNYAMSKRTSTYARYVSQTVDNTTGSAAKAASTLLVGVRHNF